MESQNENLEKEFFFTNKKGEKLSLIDITEKKVIAVTFVYSLDEKGIKLGFYGRWPGKLLKLSTERKVTIKEEGISMYFYTTSKFVTFRFSSEKEYRKVFASNGSVAKKIHLNANHPFQLIIPVENLLKLDWI